jgi:hypothetical protein
VNVHNLIAESRQFLLDVEKSRFYVSFGLYRICSRNFHQQNRKLACSRLILPIDIITMFELVRRTSGRLRRQIRVVSLLIIGTTLTNRGTPILRYSVVGGSEERGVFHVETELAFVDW